ncbi:nucleotide exchange factor GrpE [Patescibacteria group bacterium]
MVKNKSLQNQINELDNKWKRALADYQNLEKRIEMEKRDFVKFSNAALVDKLLAVLDDLERAEKHLKNKGLSIAVDQLRSVLNSEDVSEIMALGKKFDPMLMDCFEVVPGKENIVIEVMIKGYLLNNKVIRPAKVKVGGGKSQIKADKPQNKL